MKNARFVAVLAVLVALLGLLSFWIGLHRAALPNGWLYLGVVMVVWSIVALVCLFAVRVLDALCDLHKAFQLH